MSKITENIEQLRKLRGKSQAEVAEALGISQPAYSKMLREGDMRWSRVERIAEILGVSAVEIVIFPQKTWSAEPPQKSETEPIKGFEIGTESEQKERKNAKK